MEVLEDVVIGIDKYVFVLWIDDGVFFICVSRVNNRKVLIWD